MLKWAVILAVKGADGALLCQTQTPEGQKSTLKMYIETYMKLIRSNFPQTADASHQDSDLGKVERKSANETTSTETERQKEFV